MPNKNEKTRLEARIVSARSVLLAQVSPPKSGDAGAMRVIAKTFAGKVHALGVCDNRREIGMSALAAASLVAGEGVEPLLHVVTRDRNRIALASDCLGAAALGIHNVLCTSGTHQTLGAFRSARNVHDIDAVQLIQMYAHPADGGAMVGEDGLAGVGCFCVGGVASPQADPLDLQVSRLAKKIHVGVKFMVTSPVFDLERFSGWWQEVTRRGLHEKVAILAGIRVLTSSDDAQAYARRRPLPGVPEALLKRLASKRGADAQEREGVAIASETIDRLRAMPGLRGFDLSADGQPAAALAVIEAAGLKAD
ncbi:MAG: methylenetetrahydrofolate reductase [Phycisphaerae bacterium]|jgi:methylenetetrahydrofolate reductase (NADPH)